MTRSRPTSTRGVRDALKPFLVLVLVGAVLACAAPGLGVATDDNSQEQQGPRGDAVAEEGVAKAPPENDEAERSPFWVYGRVTNQQGGPMSDVKVRAATGFGTLLGGASTLTDADGRYRLHFGPGMLVMEDYAPRGVGVQAALISASTSGWYETSLNKQGGLLMSDQPPVEIVPQLKRWGRESIEQVVLPDTPREVNFTLAPAATIVGRLVAEGTRDLEDMRLSLTGPDLPPGSSVLRSLTTGDDGAFRIESVPLDKPWRFAMRVAGTWEEVETDEFTLTDPGEHRCEVSLDARRAEDRSVTLRLSYRPRGE